MNKIDLSNRNAIVTGGAQGFGLAISKRLLESGANVICWDIDDEMISKISSEMGDKNIDFNKIDDYHNGLKKLCNEYHPNKYSEFKKWCDDYFYLPHRDESRGAGGIFFDYLKKNWKNDFEFIKNLGKYFRDFVETTLIELKNEKWNEREKNIQLVKRSRYAEFNLLHDRGTKFGLETGGNIDAILMSMPPIAKWD